ncbi:PHP domain-containing protein, partial [Amaricoccus sp.]
MSQPRFIHLRLHSAYSLLEGAIRIEAIPKLCLADSMPAAALTDSGNLFAALEFSQALAKAGIQPIVGCQLDVAHAPPKPGDRPAPAAPMVLLARDETGYGNLLRLSTANYLEAGEAPAHVPLEALRAHSEGLICLTGGAAGPLGVLIREGKAEAARALAATLARDFPGRLYVEVQRHPENDARRTPAETASEPGLVA